MRGILISKDESGQSVALTEIAEADLPEGDVVVRVECSTLNYKDALAITGKGPVVRRFPMVPGIDLAGVVESSDSAAFRPGDRVTVKSGVQLWDGLTVEDDVFIGSDTQLVAPVRVGRGATLGAGTTLTKDAPPDTLTVSRAKQLSIPGWKRPVKIKK